MKPHSLKVSTSTLIVNNITYTVMVPDDEPDPESYIINRLGIKEGSSGNHLYLDDIDTSANTYVDLTYMNRMAERVPSQRYGTWCWHCSHDRAEYITHSVLPPELFECLNKSSFNSKEAALEEYEKAKLRYLEKIK